MIFFSNFTSQIHFNSSWSSPFALVEEKAVCYHRRLRLRRVPNIPLGSPSGVEDPEAVAEGKQPLTRQSLKSSVIESVPCHLSIG